MVASFPWRRRFSYGPKEKATAAYKSGWSEKCIELRGPAWPKMEVIAGFFGSGSLAALPVHRAVFSHYFKRLARYAKLATSYM